MHAVRVHAADAADVTVISNTSEITDCARRHVHPWWTSSRLLPDSVCDGPVVIADIDPETVADLAGRANGNGDVATAVDHQRGLAYRYEPEPGTVTIYGCHVEPLARAAAAFVRESMRAALLNGGWSFLRASAVVRNGEAVLLCGRAATGKTSAALTLAARKGWALLGNDRVLVRPDARGDVRVLPWPAPAAVGLGLLSGLGWYDTVRTRLRAGQAPHPAQDPRITGALLAGQHEPVFDRGSELKALFSPGRFLDWFDVPMVAGARAAGIVFPYLRRDMEPETIDDAREINRQDFMGGTHDADSRPEVFALPDDGDTDARADAVRLLAELPYDSVVLGHDVEANAEFLHQQIRTTLARRHERLPRIA
jgi:hypothetical protein